MKIMKCKYCNQKIKPYVGTIINVSYVHNDGNLCCPVVKYKYAIPSVCTIFMMLHGGMADTLGLGPSVERHLGSSPSRATKH